MEKLYNTSSIKKILYNLFVQAIQPSQFEICTSPSPKNFTSSNPFFPSDLQPDEILVLYGPSKESILCEYEERGLEGNMVVWCGKEEMIVVESKSDLSNEEEEEENPPIPPTPMSPSPPIKLGVDEEVWIDLIQNVGEEKVRSGFLLALQSSITSNSPSLLSLFSPPLITQFLTQKSTRDIIVSLLEEVVINSNPKKIRRSGRRKKRKRGDLSEETSAEQQPNQLFHQTALQVARLSLLLLQSATKFDQEEDEKEGEVYQCDDDILEEVTSSLLLSMNALSKTKSLNPNHPSPQDKPTLDERWMNKHTFMVLYY